MQRPLSPFMKNTVIDEPDHIVGDWTIINIAEDVQVIPSLFFCQIRSRDEEEEPNIVPESQYSSIKYLMTLAVDPGSFDHHPSAFMHAKLLVLDYSTGKEIFKEPNHEPVIDAPKRISLDFNKERNMLEANFKYNWESVSYHHSKKPFAFQVLLYIVANGQERLLFESRSTAISTYARRPKVSERPTKQQIPKSHLAPQMIQTNTLKRRLSTELPTPEPKRIALQPKSPSIINHDDPFANIASIAPPFAVSTSPLQRFLNVINEIKDTLSDDEKQIAITALKSKFFNSEPTKDEIFRDLVAVVIDK
jgi:hypothetical protein